VYPTQMIIKQICDDCVPVMRVDVDNRSMGVLVEEGRACEGASTLDYIIDSVDKISESNHEGLVLIFRKIGEIFGSRHVTAVHKLLAKNECVQVLVQKFIRRTQAMHPELDNKMVLLEQSINTTIHQLYSFDILRRKTSYDVSRDVPYSMHEWINNFLNGTMVALINEIS
jgi:hypothetical protein